MAAVQDLWFTDYETLPDNSSLAIPSQSSLSRGNQSHFESMLDLDTDEEETLINKNSYVGYTSRKPAKKTECQNPLEWWMIHETSEGKIAKMAWDFLAIPSMSAECEQTFSSAALTLTYCQSNMNKDTLEACKCL